MTSHPIKSSFHQKNQEIYQLQTPNNPLIIIKERTDHFHFMYEKCPNLDFSDTFIPNTRIRKYPSVELNPFMIVIIFLIILLSFFFGKMFKEIENRMLKKNKTKKKFRQDPKSFLEERQMELFFNNFNSPQNFQSSLCFHENIENDLETSTKKSSIDLTNVNETEHIGSKKISLEQVTEENLGESKGINDIGTNFVRKLSLAKAAEEDLCQSKGKSNFLFEENFDENSKRETQVKKNEERLTNDTDMEGNEFNQLALPLQTKNYESIPNELMKKDGNAVNFLLKNMDHNHFLSEKCEKITEEKFPLNGELINNKTEIKVIIQNTNDTIIKTELVKTQTVYKRKDANNDPETNDGTFTVCIQKSGNEQMEFQINQNPTLSHHPDSFMLPSLFPESIKECSQIEKNEKIALTSEFTNRQRTKSEASGKHELYSKNQEIHFQHDLFENGRFNKVFVLLDELGKGGFGEVYKVKHKIENAIYAIKKVYLPLKKDEDIAKHKYYREVMTMTQFDHKNVIRYYTSWVEEPEEEFKKQFIKKKSRKELKKSQKNKKRTLLSITSSIQSNNLASSQRTDLSNMGFVWACSNNEDNVLESNNKISEENDHDSDSHIQNDKKNSIKNKNIKESKRQLEINDSSRSSEAKSLDENSLESNFASKKSHHWSSIIQKISLDKIPVVLHIQMQYCAGQTLRNYLDNFNRDITSSENLVLFKQMIDGLKYIHSNGIIHRDLKPANIFITNEKNIIIGDFGLSIRTPLPFIKTTSFELENNSLTSYSQKDLNSHTKNVGTPLYLAPEQENGVNYDSKVDIYALGLILLELFSQFRTVHERNHTFDNLKKKKQVPNELKERFQNEAELIFKMTSHDPSGRPTSDKIMECEEFKRWEKECRLQG